MNLELILEEDYKEDFSNVVLFSKLLKFKVDILFSHILACLFHTEEFKGFLSGNHTALICTENGPKNSLQE